MSRWDDLVWRWKGFKHHWGEGVARCEEFGQSPKGKATLISAVVIAGLVILYSLSSFFGEAEVTKLSRHRMFVCSQTGKAFELELSAGMQVPVVSPHSGANTGYPAEACYWTREGKIKDDPTWVLLNEAIRKPGPTFCPDCARLVVGHNPVPTPDAAPPPLREGYVAGGESR